MMRVVQQILKLVTRPFSVNDSTNKTIHFNFYYSNANWDYMSKPCAGGVHALTQRR